MLFAIGYSAQSMGRRWKIAWAVLCGIVGLFVAYLFLSQLYQREKMTREFLQNVQEADSADIHMWVRGERSTMAVPPEQFARLKELLLHVRPLRPAMGARRHIIIDPIAGIHIAFTNAEGKKLSYILALRAFPDIMPESQAKELSLLREKDVYEPHWYLPDAELAEMHSLPIIQKSFKHNKEELDKRFPCCRKKGESAISP